MQCACDLLGDRDRYRQFYDERLALNTFSTLLDGKAVTWCLSQLAHLCIYPRYYFLRFIVRPVEYGPLSYVGTIKSLLWAAYICPCIFRSVYAAKTQANYATYYKADPHFSIFLSSSCPISILLFPLSSLPPSFHSPILYFPYFINKKNVIKQYTMKKFKEWKYSSTNSLPWH